MCYSWLLGPQAHRSADRPTGLFSLRSAELIQGFLMQDPNLSQVSLCIFNVVPYGVQLFPDCNLASMIQRGFNYDLSDEALCDRWVENPYFQYLCGEEFFQHALVFDRSSLTRWRQRMGEDKLKALLQESLAVATRTDAMKCIS